MQNDYLFAILQPTERLTTMEMIGRFGLRWVTCSGSLNPIVIWLRILRELKRWKRVNG
jgi:hypothetical protein